MKKTAKLIKDMSEDFRGNAALYSVSPPIPYGIDWDDEDEKYLYSADFVIVSAANVIFTGPETYIFPASADGEVLNWIELDGSYRGGLDHKIALRRAGYKLDGLKTS